MKRILIYFCLLVLFIPAINAQDILVLKNGEVKTVYNVEIGKESIFYTTENKHGATIHKIGKTDVFTIKKNDEVALAEDCEVVEKKILPPLEKFSVSGTGLSSLMFSYIPAVRKANDAIGFGLLISEKYNLSKVHPLYLETCIGIQYTEVQDYRIKESDTRLVSLRLPIGVGYRYSLGNDVSVLPNIGLNFRWNVAGWIDSESKTYDLFDDGKRGSDYAMGDDAWERFQCALNVGVGMEYKRAGIGVSYCRDFNKVADDMDISSLHLNVWYNFCLFRRPK